MQNINKIVNEILKNAGTWALPDSPSAIAKLDKVLKVLNENDGILQKDLWNVLGNDSLWDEIEKHFGHIKEVIKSYVLKIADQYDKHPKNFKGKLDTKALRELINKY